jgi:phosphoenolpyruvate carboxykinase (GTP)
LKAGVRRDPFAMLPFCGYNMGDYFGHWIKVGESAPDKSKLPLIFNVNWFRKNSEGKWLWPGYGDNIRVLGWIIDRVLGNVDAVETPIGFVPKKEDINIEGLTGQAELMADLLAVDNSQWSDECELIAEHQAQFGNSLPVELKAQYEALKSRIS